MSYIKRLHYIKHTSDFSCDYFVHQHHAYSSPPPLSPSPLFHPFLSSLFLFSPDSSVFLHSAYLQRRCPRRPIRSDHPPSRDRALPRSFLSDATPATFSSCSLARHGSTVFAVLHKYSERNRRIRCDRVSSPSSIVLESRAWRFQGRRRARDCLRISSSRGMLVRWPYNFRQSFVCTRTGTRETSIRVWNGRYFRACRITNALSRGGDVATTIEETFARVRRTPIFSSNSRRKSKEALGQCRRRNPHHILEYLEELLQFHHELPIGLQ